MIKDWGFTRNIAGGREAGFSGRELDERLGLEAIIAAHLSDSRHGLNIQFRLPDLLRQSIYSRLAGYDDLNDAEAERIIADALGQVPDVYREPLVLYYYEERSIDDVARSLGISPATTNKRLSRGRRYLAERVATVERSLTRRHSLRPITTRRYHAGWHAVTLSINGVQLAEAGFTLGS